MSEYHEPRFDRRTAAGMPRGAPATVPDTLADLLAAAATPPREGELVGGQPAMVAFLETAHRPTVLKPRTPFHDQKRTRETAHGEDRGRGGHPSAGSPRPRLVGPM